MRLFLIDLKDNYLCSAGMILYHTINKITFERRVRKTAMVRLVLLLSNYKSKVPTQCKSIHVIAQG
jgi:hypothetical protein